MSNHLTEINMEWKEHCLFSLKLAGFMFWGSICAVVHAILPDVAVRSSTVISGKINALIKSVGHRKKN
tara:strand:- start:315 stop:518 length:204 start_codon:yes stop_codon:yes gene_type:complete